MVKTGSYALAVFGDIPAKCDLQNPKQAGREEDGHYDIEQQRDEGV
jgi:hypothetical protein